MDECNNNYVVNVRESHLMHVFYGIYNLTTCFGHEGSRIQIETYSMKIRCKTNHNRAF